MYILKNKAWLSCVLLFGLHQIFQKLIQWNFGIFDNYLDPFLSIPILLGLVLQERVFIINRFFKTSKSKPYFFSLLDMLIMTTFFAVLFEEGFPKWSADFTKDYWDYLAYFSGTLVFYFFINE